MATSKYSEFETEMFPAGSANLAQFQFVALNGSGQLITPAASTAFCMILNDAPALTGSTETNELFSGGYIVGEFYEAVLKGVMKVIAGANLTPGEAVMSDTSGHAIAATTGNMIQGFALYAHSTGDLAEILLQRSIHP